METREIKFTELAESLAAARFGAPLFFHIADSRTQRDCIEAIAEFKAA